MYSSGSGYGQGYAQGYSQGGNQQSYQDPYQQQGVVGYSGDYETYDDYEDYSGAYQQQPGDGKTNYVRPESASDWEPYRQVISELYKTNKLKEVMEHMETQYGFKATPKQYKGRIKQWGLDTKYTKTEEYMEMLKTKKKLEKDETTAAAQFTVRGKTVSDASISRFERRAKKRGILPAEQEAGDDYDYGNYTHENAGSSSGQGWSQS